MLVTGYFSIERDKEIISTGGFFCQACVVGKPLDDVSSDPRYCQGCYEVLVAEAKLLPTTKRPKWVPKSPLRHGKISPEKTIPVSQDEVLIMHTIKQEKSKVCIIQPQVGKVAYEEKRGPKHKDLPEDLIKQWDGEGMGSKAIVSRLKRELDIKVHYSTIQRILKGQRVLV